MTINKSIFAIIISLLATICYACGDDSASDAPPVPEVPDWTGRVADRTIIVYMVANNSLGQHDRDQADIDEMLQAARAGLGNNRVVVYQVPYGLSPKLLEVSATGMVSVKTYDNSESSVYPERISQVIDDAMAYAPADSYGLILWSHSDAWIWHNPMPRRAFGQDGIETVNIPDLAEALRPRHFDFIYFDCCYMANVETLYEMRDLADYAIGSAIELPADGMDYSVNLPLLLKPQADVVGAAKATFDLYDSKSGVARTCAMSVVKLDQLDRLAEATREVYMNSHKPSPSYVPQRFVTTNPCNMYDFADYVHAWRDTPTELAVGYDAAMSSAVVYHAATPSIWGQVDIHAHCGLSTYIIPSAPTSYTAGYKNLKWWSDVAQFIKD